MTRELTEHGVEGEIQEGDWYTAAFGGEVWEIRGGTWQPRDRERMDGELTPPPAWRIKQIEEGR